MISGFSSYTENQLTFIELNIKSFSVIKLNNYWLQDLKNITYNYNTKYLLGQLKYLKKELKKTYDLVINAIKTCSVQKLPINFKIKITLLKRLNNILIHIIELLKLKKWFQRQIRIIRLPRTKPQISVLKSPHVFKKAQDHYEIRSHKVVIQIPLLVFKQEFISNIIEQTSKLSSLYRVYIKRKNIFKIKKNLKK